MKLISLMYHNIEAVETYSRYSFTIDDFKRQLALIKEAGAGAPLVPGETPAASGFAVTFDDGHWGCVQAAEALQELRWKGVFFIITKAIGTAGHLGRSDIKRLAEMGHSIGSHTVDHPPHISSRDEAYIRDQWSRSKSALEEIVGRPVTSASVPDGSYNAKVGRAADVAGLKYLFTSKPVVPSWQVGGCRVFGRFALTNRMSARRVARIAAGKRAEHARALLTWNIKTAVKTVIRRPPPAIK